MATATETNGKVDLGPTYLKFTDDKGSIVLEEELIYLDMGLARSQQGIKGDLNEEDTLRIWLPKFITYLNELPSTTVEFTETQAHLVAQGVSAASTSLKKKFSPTLTSRESTD